ncbi:MAG TPA: hypothetical protein VGL27_05140 [Negativicutes bacterium]
MITRIAVIQRSDFQKRDHQSAKDGTKRKKSAAFKDILAKELIYGGGKQLPGIK